MKKSEFIDGAVIATICIIITKILGVLYVIPFYDIIGESGGALYGYAYNIYNIFLIISSAGIPLAISKITSEYETLKMYNEKNYMYSFTNKIIYVFSFLSFAICFFGAEVIANFIIGDMTGGNSIEDIVLVIKSVSIALLFVPGLSIIRGYLQGHKFIEPSAISQVIEQFFRVLVIILGSFIAINVFNLSIPQGVAIAVFGAAIGAIIGFIYLLFKKRKIPKHQSTKELSKEEKKDIKRKLVKYCIPFIAVNLSYQIYTSIDMVLIIRALDYLNFNANDIEAISSIFTTWGGKLVAVVTSVATGLIISLIPNMVSAYTKKDMKEVNNLYQKTFEVLLMIILPISLFLSIHATSVWNIIYGESFYGPIIFKYLAIFAFFEALYIILGSITQNLNKNKLIYLTILIGLGLNAILDVPLMLLFDHIGIYPFYGAITATIIGYSVSLLLVVYKLNKEDNIKFKFNNIKKHFILTMVTLIPINYCLANVVLLSSSRIIQLLILGVVGLISLIIYVIINHKIIENLFGSKIINKIFKR